MIVNACNGYRQSSLVYRLAGSPVIGCPSGLRDKNANEWYRELWILVKKYGASKKVGVKKLKLSFLTPTSVIRITL